MQLLINIVLMVLNYIWIAFFIIAFVIALVKLVFMGDYEVFPAIMNSTFDGIDRCALVVVGNHEDR